MTMRRDDPFGGRFRAASGARPRLGARVPREPLGADRLVDNSRLEVELALLDPNPWQPRVTFDEGALRRLAESIEGSGVLQPPTVRRHPDEPGRYQIAYGERRVRACRLLGRARIEVTIRAIGDEEMLWAAATENFDRDDLRQHEEIRLVGLAAERGITGAVIARRLGKSQAWVSKRRRLAGEPSMVAVIADGILSVDEAYTLMTASAATGVAGDLVAGDLVAALRGGTPPTILLRELEGRASRGKVESAGVEGRRAAPGEVAVSSVMPAAETPQGGGPSPPVVGSTGPRSDTPPGASEGDATPPYVEGWRVPAVAVLRGPSTMPGGDGRSLSPGTRHEESAGTANGNADLRSSIADSPLLVPAEDLAALRTLLAGEGSPPVGIVWRTLTMTLDVLAERHAMGSLGRNGHFG